MSLDETVRIMAGRYSRMFRDVEYSDFIQEGTRAALEADERGYSPASRRYAIKNAMRCFAVFQRAPVIIRHRPAMVRIFTRFPIKDEHLVGDEPEREIHVARWRVAVRSQVIAAMGEDAEMTEPILLGDSTAAEVAQLLGRNTHDVHLAVRRVRARIRKSESLKMALEEL